MATCRCAMLLLRISCCWEEWTELHGSAMRVCLVTIFCPVMSSLLSSTEVQWNHCESEKMVIELWWCLSILHIVWYTALRISKIRKGKAQILLNFERNHPKLFGTGENCPKINGKIFPSNISQKGGTYGRKTRGEWLKKLKFCQGPIRPCSSNDFKTTFL